MKSLLFILLAFAALMVCALGACKPLGSITARPDPNTSTTGTIGSVEATNGVLPIGEQNGHRSLDTLIAKH